MEPETDPQFEALVRYLKETRGFDFTGYKRSSLMRRVTRRMEVVEVNGFDEYLDFLQVHPEEFTPLFNTILINVTSFFRDPEAWEQLTTEVVPELLERKGDDLLRVWSAGCAAGQEAYGLAMVLAEALGAKEYRRRVKIYATDVDDEALAQARAATYNQRELDGLSPERQERFFDRIEGDRFVFAKELRRSVIFGRNDLVQDAPISRIDLLACRNTLMYFNGETQARMLQRLHFALQPNGVLFLGKAETLLTHGGLFTPLDSRRRFFRKVALRQPNTREVFAGTRRPDNAAAVVDYPALQAEAFAGLPMPVVVIDGAGVVAMCTQEASKLFGVSERDIGRPFQDLEMSFRPAELRSSLLLATKERRVQWIRDVEWSRAGSERVCLDVQITPLIQPDGSQVGLALAFLDTTRYTALADDLDYANRQLETAYEQVQSSSEELETTNEELQSTIEELETTNEELQSTNEELETMNQELQAMNDELQSSTDIQLDRASLVDDRNLFVEAILASLQSGVVVVAPDLRIRSWSHWAEEQWGIRADEAVGRTVAELDTGLPAKDLEALVASVLLDPDARFEGEFDAVNRRGHKVRLRVGVTSLRNGGDPQGVVLALDTALP
ncbi:MAG: CheR family methyltransferase [Mycobacteriales bacterium]